MVNILVYLLKHPSFRLRCPSFLLSKCTSQLKLISSVMQVRMLEESVSQVQFSEYCSQDTGSQDRKFQVPGTRFQDPGCHGPMSQGSSSRILSVRVPCPRFPGLTAPGPGSQVLILGYARFDDSKDSCKLLFCWLF